MQFEFFTHFAILKNVSMYAKKEQAFNILLGVVKPFLAQSFDRELSRLKVLTGPRSSRLYHHRRTDIFVVVVHAISFPEKNKTRKAQKIVQV